jgi:hypothetical protein
MEMVAHDGVAEQLPTTPAYGVCQAVNQPTPIGIVADDSQSGIAPRHQ